MSEIISKHTQSTTSHCKKCFSGCYGQSSFTIMMYTNGCLGVDEKSTTGEQIHVILVGNTLITDMFISMPDKWEYPWYAAWDLAFHMASFVEIDPYFAKQLLLVLQEIYAS
jgi:hypothetical protein